MNIQAIFTDSRGARVIVPLGPVTTPESICDERPDLRFDRIESAHSGLDLLEAELHDLF